MMGERLHPRSSSADCASTAAVVTAAMPCRDAEIDASTADQMIAGRSTKGPPPPTRPVLTLLPPPRKGPPTTPPLLLPPPTTPPPRRTPLSPGPYPGRPCPPTLSLLPVGSPPSPPLPPPPTLSLPSNGDGTLPPLCAPPPLILTPRPHSGALGSDRSGQGGEPQALEPLLVLSVSGDPPHTEPDTAAKAPTVALPKGVRTRGDLAPVSAPSSPRQARGSSPHKTRASTPS